MKSIFHDLLFLFNKTKNIFNIPFTNENRVEHWWSRTLVIIAKELINNIFWFLSFWGTNEHHHCKVRKNKVNKKYHRYLEPPG